MTLFGRFVSLLKPYSTLIKREEVRPLFGSLFEQPDPSVVNPMGAVVGRRDSAVSQIAKAKGHRF
jgi:hypothetical protein